MKRVVQVVVLTLTVISLGIFAGGMAMAGYGKGPGNGSCLAANIAASDIVTISGVVESINIGTPGMVIDDGSESVTVYGIGPVWYWQSKEIARPTVGEDVTVEAYSVNFSDGTNKLIAKAITIGEQTIELRNAETGMPLWRMHR